MSLQHKNLASGRWHTFSLAEQLGNIGSEVSRALAWEKKDPSVFQGAVDRCLELFDLTLQDMRWRGRIKEVCRAREIFCDTVSGENKYGDSLASFEQYFFYFAFLARLKK